MKLYWMRLISPVVIWAIVVVGAVPLIWLSPHHRLLPKCAATYVVCAAAAIYWVYMFVSVAMTNNCARLSAASVQRLITSGVYRIVRHPVYSADIVFAWALFLLMPTIGVLLSIIWLTIVHILWMKLEEHALTLRFGEEYLDYRRRTPMFVPKCPF